MSFIKAKTHFPEALRTFTDLTPLLLVLLSTTKTSKHDTLRVFEVKSFINASSAYLFTHKNIKDQIFE